MSFFTDVFTIETWDQARARGYTVSGFPPPTVTRGGYFQSTFDRVKVGDVLLCYVKAPAKRWVGALRIEGAMYLDDADDVWGTSPDGRARYPARFKTSPIITLDVDVGLPIEETIGVLACLDSKSWSGLFRRSLTPVGGHDGDTLLQLLPLDRKPSPVRVPRKRPPKRVTVLPPVAETSDEADAPHLDEPVRGTQHLELIAKLISLGKTLGCDVWVASDERGKSHDGLVFADHILHEFPAIGLDPESKDLVRTIDVLWIRGRAVSAAFEVEATTSIYSGLLRMSDLVALQPNTTIDLYIVAPDERAQRVRDQIVRPTFEAFDPPLRSKCRFLSASSIDRLIGADARLLRNLPPTVVRDYAEVISSAG